MLLLKYGNRDRVKFWIWNFCGSYAIMLDFLRFSIVNVKLNTHFVAIQSSFVRSVSLSLSLACLPATPRFNAATLFTWFLHSFAIFLWFFVIILLFCCCVWIYSVFACCGFNSSLALAFCHTKSSSDRVLYILRSKDRSNHFFISDTTSTDEVRVTKKSISYGVSASVWNTICSGGK